MNELTTKLKDLTEKLIKKTDEITSTQQATAVFLKRHILSYLESVTAATTANDLNRARSIFCRFCIESMDWNSKLYQECQNFIDQSIAITNEYYDSK